MFILAQMIYNFIVIAKKGKGQTTKI